MLLFTFVVALLFSAAAVAYVAWPMVAPGPGPIVVEDDRITELIARKDATMMAIKELEFDYSTGKLSDEDYQRLDERLRRQAIGYIKAIEKLAPESAQMDEKIEAEITAFRKTSVAASPAPPVPTQQAPARAVAVDAAPVAVAAVGELSGQRYCTNCGNLLLPEHKFCGKCGVPAPLS